MWSSLGESGAKIELRDGSDAGRESGRTQSFVRGVQEGPDDAAVVAMVVALARALGLEVIAGGIETPGQLAALRQLGCEFGQGYYVTRPQPPAEIEQLLAPQEAMAPARMSR
jgi:EAL domain-containing protein (putative c-di-GMP-specific phosphodiesterase class I)